MVDYVSTNALSMLGGDDYGDITADIAALDASVVHKTGNLTETITGNKTFVGDVTIDNATGIVANQPEFDITNTVGNMVLNPAQTFQIQRAGDAKMTIGENDTTINTNALGTISIDVDGFTKISANSTTTTITNDGLDMSVNGVGVLSAFSSPYETTINGNDNLYLNSAGNTKIELSDTTTTLTNGVTNINSALNISNNGAPAMRLNGDNISGLYFAFHPEGTNTRRAYMGFPNGGVVNFVTSNDYTNGTISNIVNGSNKSLISTTGTVLTNGGHRIVSTGGDSEIEGTRIYNTFYTGGLFNVRFYNGSFSAAKCEINPTSTTLTNTAHTITASTGSNTIESSRTSAYGNVIRALGTAGGNSMTTASGQNLIESGGGGANLIQSLGGSARNTIYTTGTASNANFIDTYDGTGGNTIRASSGTNLISTATGQNKLLATGTVSSGAGNVLEVSAGDGGNVLKAIGTGTYGGGFNAIVGRNNYYDANPGGHFIRTGATGLEAVKISVYPTTTYMDNTNVVFTMGDQFTVNCFANRIYCSAGGFHNLRVDGAEKMVMNSTTTTLSNTTINIDATSLVALKIGGVQKIGCSSISATLNNQEIYITGSSLCYTEVNSKIRIYNQSDRNEYRFNPTATIPSSQVWRLYDNGTTNVLYLLQGTSALNGVYLANGANGWSAWSDERIKKNIKPIDTALTDILKLNPVFYNYKGDENTQPERAGFIAQEVQQVYPDIINESNMDSGDIKNLLGLDMTNLVPYLVKAIQDLNKKLDEQALIIQELVLKTSSL